MSVVTDLQNTVLSLLTEWGRINITLRRLTPGAYNPSTGGSAASTTKDYTVTGALLNYKDYEVNGTSVLAADRRCVIAAKNMTIVPAVTDTVIVDSISYNVVNLQIQEVGGTPLAYSLQIRR
jgi:hypothetical protein